MFRYLRFPESTWGGLPPAGSDKGRIYRITDYGVGGGLLVISDGTRWVPCGPQMLARSAVAVSHTGNTNETALATISIPAGAMGLNGGLRFSATWAHTNSANIKTMRVRLGGLAGTILADAAPTTCALSWLGGSIRNRGSASVQLGEWQTNRGTDTLILVGVTKTGAVATTVAQSLVISAQLALGTESVTLENYEVWINP